MASSFSDTSFAVLSVSIVGILTTSLLLLAYYLFLTKCGLWWRRPGSALPSVTPGRRHHRVEQLLPASAAVERRGLEEATIRQIPTFRYKKGMHAAGQGSLQECAVCLSEFREEERVRLLPDCPHVFHIDCIDAWLEGNANCPLCRSAVSACSVHLHSILRAAVASQEQYGRGDVALQVSDAGGACPGQELTARRLHKMCSMGDECIDGRRGEGKDLFGVEQPMRRSLSMDSCTDKQFYLALQKALQHHGSSMAGEDGKEEGSSAGGGGGRSGRLRLSFFSFSQNRSSRSAILPI